MQVCSVLRAVRGKYRMQKFTIAELIRAISSQLRHVSTIGKNLLNSSICYTCPHNMVNFGPLTAEIGWRAWSTLANFNGFCALDQPNFARSLAISWAGAFWGFLPPNGMLPGG